MQDVYYDDYAQDDSPRGMKRVLALYVKWGGAVLSLALVILFVLWAYRLGVRDAAEIPVIRALDGPVRVQPQDPGGEIVQNQGLEVNEILAGEEAQAPLETRLAPATLSLAPEDTPATTETAGPDAVPESEEAVDTAALSEVTDPEADDPLSLLEEEDLRGETQGQDLVPDDGPSPIVRPRKRPKTPLAAPAAQANEAVTSAAVGDPAPGTLLIQLGAFDSNEIAEVQWAVLLGTHEDLLGDKQRTIQRAESNGRIFHRLRVIGFDDRNDQRAMCEALIARDVDCIPVTAR